MGGRRDTRSTPALKHCGASHRKNPDTSSPNGCCEALLQREKLTPSFSMHSVVAFTDVNMPSHRDCMAISPHESPGYRGSFRNTHDQVGIKAIISEVLEGDLRSWPLPIASCNSQRRQFRVPRQRAMPTV